VARKLVEKDECQSILYSINCGLQTFIHGGVARSTDFSLRVSLQVGRTRDIDVPSLYELVITLCENTLFPPLVAKDVCSVETSLH